MLKRKARNVLYDRIHRTGVWICLGMTVYATLKLADFGYRYYRYARPQILASQASAEQELLAEGSSEKL